MACRPTEPPGRLEPRGPRGDPRVGRCARPRGRTAGTIRCPDVSLRWIRPDHGATDGTAVRPTSGTAGAQGRAVAGPDDDEEASGQMETTSRVGAKAPGPRRATADRRRPGDGRRLSRWPTSPGTGWTRPSPAALADAGRYRRGRHRRARFDRARRRAVAPGETPAPDRQRFAVVVTVAPAPGAAQRRTARALLEATSVSSAAWLAGLGAAGLHLARPDGPRAARRLAGPADRDRVGPGRRSGRARLVDAVPAGGRGADAVPLPRVRVRLGARGVDRGGRAHRARTGAG